MMKLRGKTIGKNVITFVLIFGLFYNIIGLNSESIVSATVQDSDSSVLNSLPKPVEPLLKLYEPVTSNSGTGSNFTVHDHLNVEHSFSLDFTYSAIDKKFVADYTIDTISGYSDEFLNYGITSIEAKQDNYTIEELADDDQVLIGSVLAIAQGFEVLWVNAEFYGAYLYLDTDSYIGNLGLNELDLFLVKADEATGKPNMSNIISSSLTNSYSASNPLPAVDALAYYDFIDTNLDQGEYFIVANLTVPDAASQRQFVWNGHLESSDSGGPTYYMDELSIWGSEIAMDHTLIIDMLPSDGLGVARIFTNLDEINLEDNSNPVTSFTQSISSTGLHQLASDTSIVVNFTNQYTFYQEILVSSLYDAFNSTYDSSSIYWNFTWNIESVDYSPYSNLNRSQLLFVPTDWHNTPSAQYNLTPIASISYTSEGYELFLGDNPDVNNITLQTISHNYVENLALTDGTNPTEKFTLGYWTNDGIDAFGHEGDSVEISVSIKNLESSGELNFTLFDPDGKILPIKSSLPSDLTYTDTSVYSYDGITSTGPGEFTSSIVLDPSVYGSDQVGYWTAYIFWENGSEIGIFSKRISVQSSITFNATWEVLPSSDMWTDDDSQIILRKNGDPINVKASYFSNSEPFFSEFGTPIENASIGYLTSWGLEGYLDEFPTEFSGAIPIYTTAGLRTVTITLNDSWSIQEMVNIPVQIFNEFSINPVELTVESNDSQEVILAFSMINETDPLKGTILPDTITVEINSNPVSSSFYTISDQSGIVYVTVNLASYGITSGNANISLTITKEDFKSSYNDDMVVINYSIVITADSQSPLPPFAIIAIAAAVIVVIAVIAISATVVSSRKKPEEIMDIHDKSKVVGLLESVLALKKVLILHSETSLPVFEMDIGPSSGVESTLVSGFLAALTQMGRTISGSEAGEIRKLQYRNFVVSSAKSETYTIYLFSTDDIIKEIQAKLFDIIMWFDYSFQIKDSIWDGRIEMFQEKRSLIQDKLADSLYVWLYFPLKFNQTKSKELKKLDKNDLRIALFMKKKEEGRVSEIITKFQDSPIEEILTSVFQLLNKGFLERSQFSSFKQ